MEETPEKLKKSAVLVELLPVLAGGLIPVPGAAVNSLLTFNESQGQDPVRSGS